MKKLTTFAFMVAIAIVSVNLSSCKDKNDAENEGTYRGQTVKTQFLISIAENVSGSGPYRMQADTVQQAGTRAKFRGMDNICLIPFADDFSARIGKNIVLTPIVATAGTDAAELNNASNVYYENVAIPLGTKRFLFYGKAIDRTAGVALSDANGKFGKGSLLSTNLYGSSSNPSAIHFDLEQIYPSAALPAKATNLAKYVTSIANATDGTTSWAAHANAGLHQLREDYISLIAGSSASIQSTVQDLYNTLARFQETQVSADPTVTAIMDSIEAGATVSGTAPNATLALKSSPTDLTNYPAEINLPDGAARVAWDATNSKFDVDQSGMGGMTVSALNQYVFPANLQYFAKSTIKTSIASQKSLYDGVNPWSTILAAYTNGGEVKSATKSVAIEDPINYGVGLLEADIQFTSGLKDNTDAAYTVTNPLSWSAILIGDQKRVDYEFRQVTSAESRLIYDKHMNGSLTGNPISMPNYGTTYGPNYTLVLGTQDNGEAGESHPDKVYFAVELVNTNETFFGHNNQIIPSGSKFYLVGELQVTSETGSHPEKFNIFYKDYTTTIHMTIGPNSLQNAYSTIPDLRSEGLELGFSVDLSWTPGLVFDVEF